MNAQFISLIVATLYPSIGRSIPPQIPPQITPQIPPQAAAFEVKTKPFYPASSADFALSLPPLNFALKKPLTLKLAHYDPLVMEALNQAIKLNPDDAIAYFSRGMLWIHVEDYQRSSEDFGEVIRLQSDNSKAYNYRGTSYFWLGDYEKALEDYNQALKQPEQLEEQLSLVYYNRGYIYRAWGYFSKAIENFKTGAEISRQQGDINTAQLALEIIEELEATPKMSTQALFDRASDKIQQGDYLGAIADFNQVIKLEKSNKKEKLPDAYSYRGLARSRLGYQTQALKDFEQALAIDPNHAFTYNRRGETKAKNGELDEALEDFNQALKLAPNLAEAYYNRGLIEIALNQPEAALNDYNKALELDENLAEVYYHRALLFYASDEIEKALKDFQKAADLFLNDGNLTRHKETLSYLELLQGNGEPGTGNWERGIGNWE